MVLIMRKFSANVCSAQLAMISGRDTAKIYQWRHILASLFTNLRNAIMQTTLHPPIFLLRNTNDQMSHVMRKPVYAMCEQQRRRSACASAQSDQRLCCSLTYICYSRNFKTLSSLWTWPGPFETYPEDRFSHDVTQIKAQTVSFFVSQGEVDFMEISRVSNHIWYCQNLVLTTICGGHRRSRSSHFHSIHFRQGVNTIST